MIGATVTWSRHGDAVLTPSTSQLWFLKHFSPSWRPATVSLRPARRLTQDDLLRRLELAGTTRGPRPDRRSTGLPLLQLPRVAAGDYDVVIRGPARHQGTIRVRVGRTEQVLETWPLDAGAAGSRTLLLRLPVDVHSITVDGDADAVARIDRVTLRPRHVIPRPDRLTRDYARRATRYGRVRAFFLDDNAFMEQPGFWTRGEAATTLIVDTPEPGHLSVRLRNGAAANEIDFSADGWKTIVSLGPAETRDLDLPASRGTARVLRLRTASGFRPSEVDASTADVRRLGVWVEFP
jgi:hypothetical protein